MTLSEKKSLLSALANSQEIEQEIFNKTDQDKHSFLKKILGENIDAITEAIAQIAQIEPHADPDTFESAYPNTHTLSE